MTATRRVETAPGRLVLGCLVVAVLAGCASQSEPDDRAITESFHQTAANAEIAGNHATAVNQYRNILGRDPNDRAALLGLARNLRYTGQARPAVQALEVAKKDFADDGAYQLELGKALLAVGDAAGALAPLRRALEKDGGDWDVHATLGIANDLLQRYDDAGAAYRKALALSPDNPAVLNNMALSAALSGDIERAIRILETAPAAIRRTPQIRQNMALFYGIKGDLEKAEGLARTDLDDAKVRRNLEIYSRFRANQGRPAPR